MLDRVHRLDMRFECFIFDFDGTLACSERAYREAFCHSIKLHTGLEIYASEFTDFWNRTPQQVLSRYGEQLLEEMLVSFEEHYYANHHQHIAAYDGVRGLLEELNHAGAGVAVVSLKPRRAGERELEIVGLGELVGAAVWGDDVELPKPEPHGVLQALHELEADPNTALVIGDSPADILMGRAAGTATAAALWGAANPDLLIAESPDLLLNAPRELLRVLSEAVPGNDPWRSLACGGA